MKLLWDKLCYNETNKPFLQNGLSLCFISLWYHQFHIYLNLIYINLTCSSRSSASLFFSSAFSSGSLQGLFLCPWLHLSFLTIFRCRTDRYYLYRLLLPTQLPHDCPLLEKLFGDRSFPIVTIPNIPKDLGKMHKYVTQFSTLTTCFLDTRECYFCLMFQDFPMKKASQLLSFSFSSQATETKITMSQNVKQIILYPPH